jgi:hypothetical protein
MLKAIRVPHIEYVPMGGAKITVPGKGEFPSLDAAIAACEEGDTVLVLPEDKAPSLEDRVKAIEQWIDKRETYEQEQNEH